MTASSASTRRDLGRRGLGRKVSRAFYDRDVLDVAPDCLGKILVHRTESELLAARIVEVEAYRGPEDRAAHSHGGRRTKRTEAMFGPPGRAYVFFVYGMHWHFNIVTGPVNTPHAVLVRGVEPLVGAESMATRRNTSSSSRTLTNGPGKLCRALNIDGKLYGANLSGSVLFLTDDQTRPRSVAASPRIGIDYAGEWADRPWRYYDAASPYVSKAPRRFRK